LTGVLVSFVIYRQADDQSFIYNDEDHLEEN